MKIPESLRSGIVIGFTNAVVFVVLLLILTLALGNQQSIAVQYQKAIACELAVPSNPTTGRDPEIVARCFTDQGLEAPTFASGS